MGKQPYDSRNRRDNDLETHGWRTLRFSSQQIREEAEKYCIETVAENVRKLGGVEEPGQFFPRHVHPQADKGIYQPSIFEYQEPDSNFRILQEFGSLDSAEILLDEDEIWRESVGD